MTDQPLRALIWSAVSTTTQSNEDERYSLPAQIADAESLCQREGWRIVEILKVPGHSRNYRDLHTLAADARAKGIDAFDRLITHLNAADFDILICRDANRFARKASLLHWIVETVVEECHARIYSLADGWVDSQNANIFAMVKGYETAQQVKWLVESGRRGKMKRVERGLPAGSKIVWSHKVIRDEHTGAAVKLVVDEDKRATLYHAAQLLLDGISWQNIERELFNRYGHGINGKPYKPRTFYETFNNPWAWGDSAWNFDGANSPDRHKRTRRWLFDASIAPPEGIEITRATHEPIFTGDFALRVRAEIIRRMNSVHGNNRPAAPKKFTGLVVCGRCGHPMAYHKNLNSIRYVCQSKYSTVENSVHCQRLWSVQEHLVQEWIHDRLVEMIQTQQPDLLSKVDTPADTGLVEQLRHEVAGVEQQIRRLIAQQSTAPDAVQNFYHEQIETLAVQLKTLQAALQSAERDEREQDTHTVERAYNDLIAFDSLETFWASDPLTINQLLRRLMGRRRIVAHDYIIIGTRDTL